MAALLRIDADPLTQQAYTMISIYGDWRGYQEAVAAFFRERGCTATVEAPITGARATHKVDVYVTFRQYGIECRWIVECNAFLSGDAAWLALRAGVAYERGAICSLRSDSEGSRSHPVDPVAYLRDKVKKLDQLEVDPFDTVDQALIFAERGSGCTTVLRQIALALARDGYPTLITTPHPRRLALDSLQNLVIHLQDAWASTTW